MLWSSPFCKVSKIKFNAKPGTVVSRNRAIPTGNSNQIKEVLDSE
ncbi:MAG: hypothetical protein RLZZ381_1941 [Cyanobacteriota bacterium]|jgi:hypothetical protein